MRRDRISELEYELKVKRIDGGIAKCIFHSDQIFRLCDLCS